MSTLMMKNSFNSIHLRALFADAAGFTLLEVMIAVSLIAIAVVTLFGSQSQSVSLVTVAKFDTMASLLAQRKLTELSLQEFASINDGEGDFGEDFPGFSWKMKVEELSEKETGLKKAGERLKSVDVQVTMAQDTSQTFALRTILFKKLEAKQ
jgi:general secretion pathway protein I